MKFTKYQSMAIIDKGKINYNQPKVKGRKMKRHLKNNQTHEMYIEGRGCRRANRMKDVQS